LAIVSGGGPVNLVLLGRADPGGAVAEFIARCARVFASDRFASLYREQLERKPQSLTALLSIADFHWRKREWKEAAGFALRAIWQKPKSFHALSIISTSYAHLGDMESAYRYAKCLSATPLPRWAPVKYALVTVASISALLPRTKPGSIARMRDACDVERAADLKHLAWAKELVAHYESSFEPSRAP
jgi:hypothetical protein